MLSLHRAESSRDSCPKGHFSLRITKSHSHDAVDPANNRERGNEAEALIFIVLVFVCYESGADTLSPPPSIPSRPRYRPVSSLRSRIINLVASQIRSSSRNLPREGGRLKVTKGDEGRRGDKTTRRHNRRTSSSSSRLPILERFAACLRRGRDVEMRD